MSDVTTREIIDGLAALGIGAGSTLLVHSAMRTMGRVDGGAATVIDAILETLGPSGTLVVPSFTFAHEVEEDPIVDPAADRSEMGILTETARTYPAAQRSVAFRHSFSAIGRRASVIANVDASLSPFDLRSAFGVMLALNTQVLLIGVTYSSSTSHHFAEFVCDVPYRHTIPLNVRVHEGNKTLRRQSMIDYQPKSEGGSYYGSRGPDFNRLGKVLEDRHSVSTTYLGNAAARRFSMRDLLDLAQIEAAKDFNVFRTPDGESDNTTKLAFGETIKSPRLIDGAGRPHQVEWCVRDPKELTLPKN